LLALQAQRVTAAAERALAATKYASQLAAAAAQALDFIAFQAGTNLNGITAATVRSSCSSQS
jgi:hypothetical protein